MTGAASDFRASLRRHPGGKSLIEMIGRAVLRLCALQHCFGMHDRTRCSRERRNLPMLLVQRTSQERAKAGRTSDFCRRRPYGLGVEALRLELDKPQVAGYSEKSLIFDGSIHVRRRDR